MAEGKFGMCREGLLVGYSCGRKENLGKICPVLTGNQTPCRSLARYLISRSGKREICLISTQSEGKCAMRAAYSWALLAESKFWEKLTSI